MGKIGNSLSARMGKLYLLRTGLVGSQAVVKIQAVNGPRFEMWAQLEFSLKDRTLTLRFSQLDLALEAFLQREAAENDDRDVRAYQVSEDPIDVGV